MSAPTPATPATTAIAVVDHGHTQPDPPGSRSRFGGVVVDPSGIVHLATNTREMGDLIAVEFDAGRRVVFASEAPTSIVPADYSTPRPYEAAYDRPWWEGSGRGVFTLLAVQLPAILRRVVERARVTPSATADPSLWLAGHRNLLLAEAFISQRVRRDVGRPPTAALSGHHWDALCAAATIRQMVRGGALRSNVVGGADPHGSAEVLNLSATSALWAGVEIDTTEMHQRPTIVRPDAGGVEVARRLVLDGRVANALCLTTPAPKAEDEVEVEAEAAEELAW